MSEIADLENRLSAALDRIAQGLDHVGSAEPAAADTAQVDALNDEIAALKTSLEAERAKTAELTAELEAASTASVAAATADDTSDAIEALTEAHEAELEKMRLASAAEREAWEGLNSRLVRMRRSNKLMRTNTIALRQAATDMVVDASLVNQSLQVELDAAYASQELERAETDVILKTLQPLLGEPKDFSDLEEDE